MKKGIISRNIGLLMEHFGIRNESQLAKRIGMPQATINKLISGVSADPRISTLAPIVEHFKIPLDALISTHPVFAENKKFKQSDLLIPLIHLNELTDIYDHIDSLASANWPHWHPIPIQETENFYALQVGPQQFAKPFEHASILIIKNEINLQNNSYCLVKHKKSNTISLKKVLFDNGKQWLIALQAELPASEFNTIEWELLGTIQAFITDMSKGAFIGIGT